MYIELKYWRSEDEKEVEGESPRRTAYCTSIAEVEAALGLIERHELPQEQAESYE